MWRVLLDLSTKLQSSVCIASETSEYFPIMVGLGQGETLSTLLVDIYIHDLLELLRAEGGPKGPCISQGVDINVLYLCG